MDIFNTEKTEFNQTIFFFENDTSVTIDMETLEVTDSDGLPIVPKPYLEKIEKLIGRKIIY